MSTEHERLRLGYQIEEQIKWKMNNDHLWYSIIARPVGSSFTRLDRLTCCFVILSLTMLMSILYYGSETSTTNSAISINIGPYINLNIQQISVGLISSLVVLIPGILLVELFRRIKRRKTHLDKLRFILNRFSVIGYVRGSKNFEKVLEFLRKDKKPSSFKIEFPWWFKFVPYLISFILSAASLSIVLTKGVEFGNEKAAKWLGSILSSLFGSIFITQPLIVSFT